MQDWIKQAEELLPELSRVRRYLHQHPEVSFQEEQTASFLREYLAQLGIPYIPVGTSTLATVDSGKPGPVIALRAEIDALPVIEENQSDYASKREGFMHACGHDAHTAAVLLTASLLRNNLDKFCGQVRFLFQAAEEAPPGGALDLIQAGALEGVSAIYGFHVSPDLAVGEIGVIHGPMMAAADRFSVKIVGRGGHGASPQQTIDVVVVAGQILNNLQAIVSRNVNPLDAAVISVGEIKGGFRFNVISETCTMEGTVRTLRPETRQLVRRRLEEVISGTVLAHGASYQLDYEYGYPPVINPKANADIVRSVARELFGEAGLVELPFPSMGGDDYAYYLEQIPGTFFRLGTRLTDREQLPLHNPRFDLDERAMVFGVQILAGLVQHHCLPARD